MNKEEKVYLASKFAEKGYDYETILYGDDLYNVEDKDSVMDEIWDLVCEYNSIGSIQFRENYKDYKLY